MPHWDSQDPSAFGWKRGAAADIVPFSWHGYRFPSGVARLAVPAFTMALDLLQVAGWVPPPDKAPTVAGTWGFDDRRVSGTDRWSFHAYGLALDVAAPWNPQGSARPPASPHRLPSHTGALMRPLGIAWGGDWKGRPDWMHLELHTSPHEMGAPPPAPAAPSRPPSEPRSGQAFPLPAGHYYGPWDGPRESISGRGLLDGRWRHGLAAAQRELGTRPDGIYGPATSNATRAFQAAHGLTVDGLIGPATWRALFG